jgi:hypothetical protein
VVLLLEELKPTPLYLSGLHLLFRGSWSLGWLVKLFFALAVTVCNGCAEVLGRLINLIYSLLRPWVVAKLNNSESAKSNTREEP